MQELTGCLEHIIYRNEDTGFSVARLGADKNRSTTVIVGMFASLNPGEIIKCMGSYKQHHEYGKQFSVV